VEFLPEAMIEVDADGFADFSALLPTQPVMVIGKTYRVRIDGAEYLLECVQPDEESVPGIGAMTENDTTPFVASAVDFGDDSGGYQAFIFFADGTASTSVNMSIYEVIYETLPQEYLPEQLKQYTINIPASQVTNDIAWVLDDLGDGDKVAQTLYHGGSVVVDTSAFYTEEYNVGSIQRGPVLNWAYLSGTGQLIIKFIYNTTEISAVYNNLTWTPPTT
jgi:hypothetical protein